MTLLRPATVVLPAMQLHTFMFEYLVHETPRLMKLDGSMLCMPVETFEVATKDKIDEAVGQYVRKVFLDGLASLGTNDLTVIMAVPKDGEHIVEIMGVDGVLAYRVTLSATTIAGTGLLSPISYEEFTTMTAEKGSARG